MYQKELSWLGHWIQRMTLSSTSSGRYRAGLHGERSVPKPMESPLNSREPRWAPWCPEQTPRGSGSLLSQVWAIMDFRPIVSLVLLSAPLHGWTPPLHVLTKRLPKVLHFRTPWLTPAHSIWLPANGLYSLITPHPRMKMKIMPLSRRWAPGMGPSYGTNSTSVITTTTIIISVIKKLTLNHCKWLMVLKHHNNSHDGRCFGIPTS